MIHTVGEQIQGNKTRTLEIGGRESAKKKGGEGGGWASWTAQALFGWTRTHDEPGKSGTFGYIVAGLLCADVSFTYRALARYWAVGVKASHGNNRLLHACFLVFPRCAKKRIFNSFTSFSRWKWFIFNHLNSSRALWLSWKLCDFGSRGTRFEFHHGQLFISVSLFFHKVRTAKISKSFTWTAMASAHARQWSL